MRDPTIIALCIVLIMLAAPFGTTAISEPEDDRSLADSPWPMFRGNLKHTGLSVYDTSDNPGETKWKFETPYEIFASPVIGDDGMVYFPTLYGKFYAVDRYGDQKWTIDLDEYRSKWHHISTPALSSDGTIYVGTPTSYLYALKDGEVLWKFKTKDFVQGSVTIGPDGTIYFGCEDFNFYALNPNGKVKWTFKAENEVTSAAAIADDGTIYFGSVDEHLYALDQDGKMKWRLDINDGMNRWDDELSAPAIGSDGTIYVGGVDSYLYAVDPDGTVKWRYKVGERITSSPAIGSDGTIYFGSFDDNMYSVRSDGTLNWIVETGGNVISSPAIGADGTIFVGSQDSNLYAINEDGSIKWKYKTGAYIDTSVAIDSDGTVIFGSGDHFLYAVGHAPVKPTPPLDLEASSGDGNVSLSFSPSLEDGNAKITNYNLYRANGTGDYSMIATLSRWATNFDDMTAANGVVYSYRMTAMNKVGESDSSQVVIGTPTGLPYPPMNLTGTNDEGKILLKWEPPEFDGGDPLTHYEIFRSDEPGLWVSIGTFGTSSISFFDENVTPGDRYSYYLSAYNSIGESPPSNEVSVTQIDLPEPPINITVTKGDSKLTLDWKASPNNGEAPVSGFYIYRQEGHGNKTLLDLLDVSITSYVDNNLTNGHLYQYWFTAVNLVGEGLSSKAVQGNPMGTPLVPGDFNVIEIEHKVNVSWSEPDDGGSQITQYWIYRSQGNGTEEMITSVVTPGTSYLDDDVKAGKTYHYRITAVNVEGAGPSTEVLDVKLKKVPKDIVPGFGSSVGLFALISMTMYGIWRRRSDR